MGNFEAQTHTDLGGLRELPPITTLKLDRVRRSANATICEISIVYFSPRNHQMMLGILRPILGRVG